MRADLIINFGQLRDTSYRVGQYIYELEECHVALNNLCEVLQSQSSAALSGLLCKTQTLADAVTLCCEYLFASGPGFVSAA